MPRLVEVARPQLGQGHRVPSFVVCKAAPDKEVGRHAIAIGIWIMFVLRRVSLKLSSVGSFWGIRYELS
jgi:hypothetical protein